MKTSQLATAGLLAFVFASSLAAQSDRSRSQRPAAATKAVLAAESNSSCRWSFSTAPNLVRSPIQMDIHAAYRMFVFESDGSAGYRVRGQFPFAAFMSFGVYNGANGLLHAAKTDYEIKQDQDAVNPFTEDALVDAPNRSYTITVLPDGATPDDSMPNPIFLPPPPHGSNTVRAVLVHRIYLPEPGVDDRFGGVEEPVIEPFEVSSPETSAACPPYDAAATAPQVESMNPNFSQSPLPKDGVIRFYRPPVSGVPFADGSGELTKHDCTSYLMATVYPQNLAVIRLPAVPEFFDNTNTTPETVFKKTDVRYLSLGAYGASWLGVDDNENVAGPDLKKLPDGSAMFIAIPIGFSEDLKQQIKDKAAELEYNVLPLAQKGDVLNPFLIYRNKVPKPGFVGDIGNVPCFKGADFGRATLRFAASAENMQQYAPTGVECLPSEFLYGTCGQ
jgi:hypothetical protein